MGKPRHKCKHFSTSISLTDQAQLTWLPRHHVGEAHSPHRGILYAGLVSCFPFAARIAGGYINGIHRPGAVTGQSSSPGLRERIAAVDDIRGAHIGVELADEYFAAARLRRNLT